MASETGPASPEPFAGSFRSLAFCAASCPVSRPHLVRFRFPEGDSLQDLCAGAADTIRLALERQHNETVVMVGHESVNRAILLQTLDQPLSAYWRLTQDPCASRGYA